MTQITKKTSKNKNSVFSFRIDDSLKQKLAKLGESIDRTSAYVAEKAILEYVEYNTHKTNIIRKALEQADKGIFTSHEKVINWLQTSIKKGKLGKMPASDITL